jgi:hypothetical protein
MAGSVLMKILGGTPQTAAGARKPIPGTGMSQRSDTGMPEARRC